MRWLVVGIAVVLSGCFSSNATTCSDGTVCPETKVCAPTGGTCVDPEQVEACRGAAEGAACMLASVGHGVCRNDVCVTEGCGDGTVEPGEACDDGNTTSGDGCRADCQKIEMCGDGMLDDGEACDDGNTNPADGCDGCKLTEWTATPVIGGNAQPLATHLLWPSALAVDRNGNVFVADQGHYRVLRLDRSSNAIVTVAGNGTQGYSGDGGPATDASLEQIRGLAVDGLGNLYIATQALDHVRRVDAVTGIITTYAGTGGFDNPWPGGGQGDNGLATAAHIRGDDVAVDGLGNVFIAETQSRLIRRVDLNGIITTFAGGGSTLGDTAVATDAQLAGPTAVAVDTAGNVYFVDQNMLRKVDTTGALTTISASVTGTRLAIDSSGDLYCIDPGLGTVYKVAAADGTITPIAGGGIGGDGGLATSAQLLNPSAVAVDPGGNVWIGQMGDNVVRVVHSTSGIIERRIGDTSVAISGELTAFPIYPQSIAIDAQGRPTLALDGNIARYDAGTMTPVANLLGAADGIALDASGNVYAAERFSHRVVQIDGAGNVNTIAGSSQGFSGDGGQAINAQLAYPGAVAVDGSGNVFIDDCGNGRVRRVDHTTHVITTIATGLDSQSGIAVDSGGNVYVADTYHQVVKKIDSTLAVTVIAGTGTQGSSGDGGQATAAELDTPVDVFLDPMGRICIVEQGFDGRIRRIAADGTISTIAGGGLGWFGDLGPAVGAGLGKVTGAKFAADGTLYVIDQGTGVEGHLRRIDTNGTIATIAGHVEPQGMGAIATSHPLDPGAMVPTPAGLLIAGGSSGTVQVLGATTIEVAIGRYLQDVPTGALARYRDSTFPAVGGVVFDAAATVAYITAGNEVDAVTLIDPSDPDTWTITQVATGFSSPTGLAWDAPSGTLYVADTGNHVVRAVQPAFHTVRTFAGTLRTLGYAGDGLGVQMALLNAPTAVAVCGGDVFIADTGNNRVRRVSGGIITTVLGDGVPGSSGQGAPASQFPVNAPRGLACDAIGDLFVTSTNSVRVLPANFGGVVDGSGPVATIYGEPPRDTFPSSVTRCLSGIVVLDDHTVRVSDSCTGMLIDLARMVKP
jgi:cysteine-rich repeat protein